MHAGPDPDRARAVLAGLDAVRATVGAAEDDVLACLVVTGEPGAQRVLDDWLDQVADTLRALGEVADELAPVLATHAASSGGSGAGDGPAGGCGPASSGAEAVPLDIRPVDP